MIWRWPCTKTSGLPPLLLSSTWPPSSLSVYSRLTVAPFCTAPGARGVWASVVDAVSATNAAASCTMRVIVTTSGRAKETEARAQLRLYTRRPRKGKPVGQGLKLVGERAAFSARDRGR